MVKATNFDITHDTVSPELQKTACLVIGLKEGLALSAQAQAIDNATQGLITELLNTKAISEKAGETLYLPYVPGLEAQSLLLVGLGDGGDYQSIMNNMMQALLRTPSKDAVLYLTDFAKEKTQPALYWAIRQVIESGYQALYRFNTFKTENISPSPLLAQLTLLLGPNEALSLEKAKAALTQSLLLAQAIKRTKDLGNMPPNICTPSYLAEYAQKLGETHPIDVHVLEQSDMIALNMGLFLSVTQGSKAPPKFIVLEYKGKTSSRPVVLVGKGITFDTGGNSLKPSNAMVGMKYDMCGAASVLGVMECVSALNLPIHLVGLIPTCENMPGGSASRPDDIVKSMSGLTVEIVNTDAEGRLILADALTYAERYQPDVVIDIATLTGACIAALGHFASGLLGNHAPLIQDLLKAGQQTKDRAWELPLWKEYESILASKFADIANANMGATSNAGTITAACFLAKFTQKYHWAHLDVAGSACYFSGDYKGATGRPVSLLVQYILNRIEHHA